MDIQKIISEVVSKITGKTDLIEKFTSDPTSVVKELTGIDVDADQIKEIVSGVTSALNGNIDEVKTGLLQKIKNFFSK